MRCRSEIVKEMNIIVHHTGKSPAATKLLSSNLDHDHQLYSALIPYSGGKLQAYLQHFEAVSVRIYNASLNPHRFEAASASAG